MYNSPADFELRVDPNFDPIYGTQQAAQQAQAPRTLKIPWYRRMLAALANPVEAQYGGPGVIDPRQSQNAQLQPYQQLGSLIGGTLGGR